MIAAFAAFWVLLVVGRDELGLRGIIIAIAFWVVLMAGCVLTGPPGPALFMSAQAILDVALLLILFGGDIRIR